MKEVGRPYVDEGGAVGCKVFGTGIGSADSHCEGREDMSAICDNKKTLHPRTSSSQASSVIVC